MNKETRSSILSFGIILLVSVALLAIGYRINKAPPATGDEILFCTAQITAVRDVVEDDFAMPGMEGQPSNKTVFFFAKITSGEQKDRWVFATQYIDYIYASPPRQVEEGDKVLLSGTPNPETGELSWSFVEHNRIDALVGLGLVFFGLILLIGRSKGVATILSLVLTVGAIFGVYIPAILWGKNIYLYTVLVAVYVILMSLLLLNGINIKSFCAIVGNIGGVLVAGALALVMNGLLGITGVVDEQYVFLMYLERQKPLDLQAVVWGGILIGSLGAVMDIAMSIASAMKELSDSMEHKTFANMVKSGMNIGKDAIGTMTNTLILAYIGGSLATVLLLVAYNKAPLLLFNMEMIVVEVLQAIVGSMGILFAVPITVFVSATLFCREQKQ